MGAKILQVSFAQALSGRRKRSAIQLSTDVGLNCLHQAGMTVDKLEALINSGIYRDKHIGEPAIAALIHGDIQKKASQRISPENLENFFCFDISNGGNGSLNAIEIASGLIDSGKLNNALIISGDALPRRNDWLHYPFGSHASATLLGASGSVGFKNFFSRSFPEFIHDYSGELQWSKRIRGTRFHHQLLIERSNQYLTNCISCAKETLLEFLLTSGKTLNDFDLMITSHSPNGFTQSLKEEFNLPKNFLIEPVFRLEIHTAGLGKSLKEAWNSGQFHNARNILFLSVGAGIQVSVAWYQNNGQHE